MSVTVSNGIQPVSGLMFTKSWAVQKRFNDPFVCTIAGIAHERFQLFWLGRQPGQHDRSAACQGCFVSRFGKINLVGFELRFDVAVDLFWRTSVVIG